MKMRSPVAQPNKTVWRIHYNHLLNYCAAGAGTGAALFFAEVLVETEPGL